MRTKTRFALLGITAILLSPLTITSASAYEPQIIQYITDSTGNKIPVDAVQTFTASNDIKTTVIERGTYTATPPEEAARNRAIREAKDAQMLAYTTASNIYSGYSNVFPEPTLSTCTSVYCWPLTAFDYDYDNNGYQTGTRPSHQGFDMLAPALTPIYAVTAGTVTVSSESYYGFGVAIVINSNIEGTNANLTYGHMSYGTRTVVEGQQVNSGQIIGFVGSTGNSSANHLHLEVNLNGGNVDPHTFLQNYAG